MALSRYHDALVQHRGSKRPPVSNRFRRPYGLLSHCTAWGGPVGETNFWIGFRTPFWGHPQEPVLLEGSKWHLAVLKQGLP